jgi:hypothetical protein
MIAMTACLAAAIPRVEDVLSAMTSERTASVVVYRRVTG